MSKRRWLHKHRLEAGIAVIFCLIGFLIGLATRFDLKFGLQFEDKVNATDVLSIICTVILAWIVTTVLDKEKHAEHTSKEIISRRLEELYHYISEVAFNSTTDSFALTSATSATKRINLTVASVYTLLESINSPAEDEIKNKIEIQVEKLNDLMTNTPVKESDAAQQPAVRVEANMLYFSKERKLEIENAFENLKNHIISLELAVNNS